MKKETKLPEIKFDYFDVKEEVIDGVKVFSKELPWVSGVFSFNLQFQAGAYYDPKEKEGLAHIYEHMCLKGVPSAPDKEAMQIARQEIFMNTLNASTSPSRMRVLGKALIGKIDEAEKILSEIVSKPILDDAVFQDEKKVIEQEFWRRHTSPKDYELQKLVNTDIWRDHFYSRFLYAFGGIETMKACTKDDLHWYINTFLNRSNLSVFVAGDVSNPQTKKFIKSIIESLPKGEPTKQIPLQSEEWLPLVPERRISDKEYFGKKDGAEVKQTSVSAGRVIPSTVDRTVTTLSTRFLSALLNRELRIKRNLVYGTSAGTSRARYGFEMNMSASVDPQRETETIEVMKNCLELAVGDTESEMFERIKTAYMEQIITSESSSEDVVEGMASEYMSWGEVTKQQDELDKVAKVEHKDAQDFIKKWFDLKGLYWYIFTP